MKDNSFLKKNWITVCQLGTWVTTVLVSVLTKPDLYECFKGKNSMLGATNFLVCGAIGLLFIPIRAFQSKRHTRLWGTAGVAFFLLAAYSIFYYNLFFDLNTVRYNNTWTVVCEENCLNQNAKHNIEAFEKENQRVLSLEEIVMKVAGDTEALWNREMLIKKRNKITIIYSLSVLLCSISIISISQALNCSTKRK